MRKTPIKMLKGVMFGFLTRAKPKTLDEAREKLRVAFQEKVIEADLGEVAGVAAAWWAKREAKREARKVARMRISVNPPTKRKKRKRSRKPPVARVAASTTADAADNLSALRVLFELVGDSSRLETILAAVQKLGGPAKAIAIVKLLRS